MALSKVVSVLCCLAFLGTALANPPAPPSAPEASTGVVFRPLENGLEVAVVPRPQTTRVVAQLWLPLDHSLEGSHQRGALDLFVALLEERLQETLLSGPAPLAAAAEGIRTQVHPDAVGVSVEGPALALQGILRALSLSVRSQSIHPLRFQRARGRALARRKAERTSPAGQLEAALFLHGFRINPYRNRYLPQESDLERRDPEDLKAFLEQVHTPEGARLVVLGNLREGLTQGWIIQEFGSWPRTKERPTPSLVLEPKHTQPVLVRTPLPLPEGQEALGLGISLPSSAGRDDLPALLLLEALDPHSGTKLGSLLGERIPPGVSVEVHHLPTRRPSLAWISLVGPKLPTEALVSTFHQLLASLKDQGLRDEDIARVQGRIRSKAMLRSQGLFGQARGLALTSLLQTEQAPTPFLHALDGLTPSDFQEFAKRQLGFENVVVVHLAAPGASEESSVAPTPEPPPRSETLASGVRLLEGRETSEELQSLALRLELDPSAPAPGDRTRVEFGLGLRLLDLARKEAWGWMRRSSLEDRLGPSWVLTFPRTRSPKAIQELAKILQSPWLDSPPPYFENHPPEIPEVELCLDQRLSRQERSLPRFSLEPEASQGLTPETETALRELEDFDRLTLVSSHPLSASEREVLSGLTPPLSRTGALPNPPPFPKIQERRVLVSTPIGSREEDRALASTLAELLARGAGSRLGRRTAQASSRITDFGARVIHPGPHREPVFAAWIGAGEPWQPHAELLLREELTRLTQEPPRGEELIRLLEIRRDQAQSHNESSARRTLRLLDSILPEAPPRLDQQGLDPLGLQRLAREIFEDVLLDVSPPTHHASRTSESP